MLAIRLQRTGRKGHSQYRVIVQDSRFSPKSARVVQYLGSYNPHTKEANIDVEASTKYLKNGAQPSDRVASILKESGVKLPKWYSPTPTKKRSTKNPEKLRKNRPADAEKPAQDESSVEPEPVVAEADATEDGSDESNVESSTATDEQVESSDQPEVEESQSDSEPTKTDKQ